MAESDSNFPEIQIENSWDGDSVLSDDHDLLADTDPPSGRRKKAKVQELRWYHNVGDFFNCFKAFIGTNYQTLPFAFHNSGLALGIVGVFIIAVMNDHCIQLLVKSKNLIIDRKCQEQTSNGDMDPREVPRLRKRLQQTIGYGDIGKAAIGPWCFHVIQIAVWFTQFMGLIAYFIFIGNTIYEMFPTYPVPYIIQNGTSINNTSLPDSDPSWFGLGIPMLGIGPGRRRRSVDHISDLRDNVLLFPNDDIDGGYSEQFATDFPATNITSSSPDTTNASTDFTVTHRPATTDPPHANLTTMTANPLAPTFKPAYYTHTIAPDLRLLILIPLPFFLGTSLIRKMRYLAPFSSIATVALAGGAFSVLGFIIANFQVSDFEWYKITTLPLFTGQIISSFEGIGCVIPIQSSMDGNRHLFPGFVHGAVVIVSLVLCSFGTLGYLTYGSHVSQIIVMSIPQHSILAVCIDVTLVISVLFTYPLQGFPVLDIMETYVFSKGKCCTCCRRSRPGLEVADIQGSWDFQGLGHDAESSIEASAGEISSIVPKSVPAWKRNILRIGITLAVVSLAVLLRHAYAYIGAFTGAMGASLLALVLPCVIHLSLRWGELSRVVVVKDIAIVVFAVVSSILTLVSLGTTVIKIFWK